MAEKKPKTLEDVRQALYLRAWNWLARRHWSIKIVFAALVLVLGAVAARVGLMGDSVQKIARAAIPKRISAIEPPKPRPALTVTFDVIANGLRTPGREAAIYGTGDVIILHILPSADAWTLIFGVDANGRHAVMGRNFEPVVLQGDKTHDIRFRLDDTLGVETYYAIAAAEAFNFDKDIVPKLDPGKGPQPLDLPLDERFAQQAISFTHVAR